MIFANKHIDKAGIVLNALKSIFETFINLFSLSLMGKGEGG